MKITPLDIRRKEFKRSMRGYSDEEVDVFLDEVADEFERIFQENMELQERAHRLDEQIAGHVQLKDALEKTLISAQLQSEEIRANAHKESELILRDAELKARGIVSESYNETQRTQQALVQLKLLEEDFRLKFRSLLEGYLRLISQAPLSSTGPDAATLTGAPEAAGTPQPGAVPAAPAGPVTPLAEEAPAASEPLAAAPPVRPVTTGPAPAPVLAPAPAPVSAAPVVQSQPAPQSDEDIPTEENLITIADPGAIDRGYAIPETEQGVTGEIAMEEVTAENPPLEAKPADEAPQGTEPLHGFFFGRQMDDFDGTFAGEDGTKKEEKTRDFEW